MGDELIQPLKAAGIPTAALMLGKEAETRQWIKLIAQSLGKPERGEQLVAWREQMERKVRAQVAKVPANQRLKIMYMSRYKTGLAAAGQSSFFQYEAYVKQFPEIKDKMHACGIGKTYDLFKSHGVDVYPMAGMEEFKSWTQF